MDMNIKFDERGREILSEIPAAFVVPDQRRISALDFHRAKLLEQREAMRRAIEEIKEESEFETFAEANDFRVDDPFDPNVAVTDFELDDDSLDGLETLARKVYDSTVAKTPKANRKDIKTSTEPEAPLELQE